PDSGRPDGGAGALSCADYCATLMANCTSTNAQFPTLSDCTKACAAYPVGALTDATGDTLGCRAYHAQAAAFAPTTHCPHAGPFGGKAAELVCGTMGHQCEAFCEISQVACTGVTQVWADVDACKADCASFANNVTLPYGYADSADVTSSFNCRSYHLIIAL